MLANRVNETSATTGTGNLTLDGAVTNFRTFTSQFVTNQRIAYSIDNESGAYEHGIGYLSSSTVLVRETVLDSSNSGALVSFTGTLQVYVSSTSDFGLDQTYGNDTTATVDAIQSANIHRTDTSAVRLLVVDRIFYMPFYLRHSGTFDAILHDVRTSSGAGTILSGLYDRDINGKPKNRLISCTGGDPATTGLQYLTFTSQVIKPGWYFIAVWSDQAATLTGFNYIYTSDPNTGLSGAATLRPLSFYAVSGQSSLTAVPADAQATGSFTRFDGANAPRMMLRFG